MIRGSGIIEPGKTLCRKKETFFSDRVFENREHDHIGIVIEKHENSILAAEGSIDNKSGMIERLIDRHIRGYIRIPDGFQYKIE